MISPKHCPHCLKKIPWRKRWKPRCPFCFKTYRRRSGMKDRSLIGQWLEDRNIAFWFFQFLLLTILAAITMQLSGYPDLIRFIDARPVWFAISIWWAAMYMSVIGRIYFPLLVGAPKILRRERAVIKHYQRLTTIGLIIGIPFALLFVGLRDVWLRFPGTVFLLFIPVSLFWAYQALTLTDVDYEDERVFTFLQELGAQDRLEHRHQAYFVMIGLPLAGLLFYYFMTHHWLADAIRESTESGILAMFRELWQRTTGRG
ncbi:hypothetical protein EHM69_10395 [candidate division KSB1 bacterium]|nr:MAG: hypothetical protein EHM69_10395 [candidate division KSB1 bacterium]